jgi:hypothetical protein
MCFTLQGELAKCDYLFPLKLYTSFAVQLSIFSPRTLVRQPTYD